MIYPKLLVLFLLTSLTYHSFSQTLKTNRWRKTERDSMANAQFLFEDKNYTTALPIFEKLYKAHPKEMYLKFCYGKCGLYRGDKHKIALELLLEVYEKNKKIDEIQYDLARASHYNYKFDEAITLLDNFLLKKINPTQKKDALALKQYCINAKVIYSNPTGATVTNAGNIINTPYNEYVPVISANESSIIYTYTGPESIGGLQNEEMEEYKYGQYYEDIFYSKKEIDIWTKPTPINTINTKSHDAAIALSTDGLTLFAYKDTADGHGDIYASYFKNGNWTSPEKLLGDVNSYSWEGSCSLSADGSTLYFSSERRGGFGGKDIYRASLLSDGSWGQSINLGDSINTNLDDDSPFIHPDGVTLFYSSKGKNSMGDYDIFQSYLNTKDSTFSTPINLGYPINTPDGDRFYVLSANGESGYYASAKDGGQGLQDIYIVSPGYVGQKPSLQLLKGTMLCNNQPIEGKITVSFVDTIQKKISIYSSNSQDGNYLMSLPAGSQFLITYTYKSFPSKTLVINTTHLEGYSEQLFDVHFKDSDTLKIISVKKDTLLKKEIVFTKNIIVTKDTITKPKINKALKKINEFTPSTALLAKIKRYTEKYPTISSENLEFKVQIAAYKKPKNYVYANLKKLGKIEKLLLDDGLTRITIGGKFKTLTDAFIHNIKVINAGQKDAFVTVLFKGKRIQLEELEKIGIFK